jgi:hypothetical protein
MARHGREPAGIPLVTNIRRLAKRLRHHGDLLEQRNVEQADSKPPIDPTSVWQAAEGLEAAASDQSHAGDAVREALDTADASLDVGTADETQPA